MTMQDNQTPHTAAELRDEMRAALAAAQAEVARLREALEWALREIDGDNIYRRGDQQIAAHDRARAVLESPKP
jgi:hypothetical protein